MRQQPEPVRCRAASRATQAAVRAGTGDGDRTAAGAATRRWHALPAGRRGHRTPAAARPQKGALLCATNMSLLILML